MCAQLAVLFPNVCLSPVSKCRQKSIIFNVVQSINGAFDAPEPCVGARFQNSKSAARCPRVYKTLQSLDGRCHTLGSHVKLILCVLQREREQHPLPGDTTGLTHSLLASPIPSSQTHFLILYVCSASFIQVAPMGSLQCRPWVLSNQM